MTTRTRGAAARTLELYRCIAAAPGHFTLKAMAEQVGLPQSTVHRLLEPWVRRDLLERGEAKSYRFGPELYRLASLVQCNYELPRRARPVLTALWKEWQETVVLCLFNPSTGVATVADSIPSPYPLKYELQANSVIPLAWGSLGRVILAHLPEADIDAVLLHSPAGPLSQAPLPTRRALQKELAQIRGNRYALYHGSDMDIAGVSAAVLQGNGRVIGSIGVIMPGSRFTRHVQARLPARVVAAARSLGNSAFQPPGP